MTTPQTKHSISLITARKAVITKNLERVKELSRLLDGAKKYGCTDQLRQALESELSARQHAIKQADDEIAFIEEHGYVVTKR